ncbi:hypothetical protein B0H13DRAFT_2357337 [Mycena leptocephala]|nr:hypothetical protein B0H13DRAFT_2357337 [Mycena leptocephala]
MRLSTTLFVFSATGIVIASQCAICPKEIKDHNEVYRLVVNDHDASTNSTFCGYIEEGEMKEKKQAFCSYDDSGKYIFYDLANCPSKVGTKNCKDAAEN